MYKLDHIVHFVNKPETVINQMNAIGVHTVLGGRHEMWGTYNALSYFDNLSYIEYIGIFDEDLFKKSAREPYTLHETYEKRNRENGFNRIAFRTNNIEEDARNLNAAGLTVYGPDTFSRKRPDGSIVQWKLLHFGLEEQSIDFPFLIEWESEESVRYDELVGSSLLKEHKLGNLKVKEIIINVSNIETIKKWAQLLNFKLEITSEFVELETQNCNLLFNIDSNGDNKIKEVIIHGATEEKVIEIENAIYKFIR